jgi:hypothetical protein
MPPQASETTSERPQWERIAGENRKAYEAFRRYRDAGSHGPSPAPDRSSGAGRGSGDGPSALASGTASSTAGQDQATPLAAGGARPTLEVVGPLAELNDDP